jgi:hypothetical protein
MPCDDYARTLKRIQLDEGIDLALVRKKGFGVISAHGEIEAPTAKSRSIHRQNARTKHRNRKIDRNQASQHARIVGMFDKE